MENKAEKQQRQILLLRCSESILECFQYSIDVYKDILRLVPESLPVNITTERKRETVRLAQGKRNQNQWKKKHNTLLLHVIVEEEDDIQVFQFANGNQLECHTLCVDDSMLFCIHWDWSK